MNKLWQFLVQFWDFIWNDDSLLSWVLNIVVAFLLIKFIIYPGLGFIFGTQYPIVAVVSGSMEHDGTFDDWWSSAAVCPQVCQQQQFYAQYNISKEEFQKFEYANGFNTGDIMVLVGKPHDTYEVGEIVVFFSARGEPIIHRIINIQEKEGKRYFHTKGDHNPNSISTPALDEMRIAEEDIIGKAVMRIPYLGWIKIIFFNAISSVGMFLKSLF